MNWKKLTVGITAVNLLGWALIELWSHHYADTNIERGAGLLIVFHLIGYYVIAIGARIKVTPTKPPPPDKYNPANCPGHDWQKHKYGSGQHCVICGAERGV